MDTIDKSKLQFKSQLGSDQYQSDVDKKPLLNSSVDLVMLLDAHSSASSIAANFAQASLEISQNQTKLERGLRCHSSQLLASGYNVLNSVGKLVGYELDLPSLPQLLDIQEQALNSYARCLHFMSHTLRTQYVSVTTQVDEMEKSLQLYSEGNVSQDQDMLREQIRETPNRAKRRELMDKLYVSDRTERSLELSTHFFEQYVAQELSMRDMIHSLELLTDTTTVFETYIQTSKGFFASVDTIGSVVGYITPFVEKMRDQVNILQVNSASIVDYVATQSNQSLFNGNSGIVSLNLPQRKI